ncbi:MAG: GNAT family N-acetyltransferase [Rhodobacteraceae bacterium]|nr:GNAT family N-acetyltransferase [Paracoccaceae bacterium]
MTVLRTARPTDAGRCHAIESAAYPPDEAATLPKIIHRIEAFPQGFLVLEVGGQIVGFINSGCTDAVDLGDDGIKDLCGHDPEAANVVILSVVVDPAHQGHGHARVLMADFIERMRDLGKTSIFLICKDPLIPFYERAGFRYLRPSASAHGGAVWHEMVQDL